MFARTHQRTLKSGAQSGENAGHLPQTLLRRLPIWSNDAREANCQKRKHPGVEDGVALGEVLGEVLDGGEAMAGVLTGEMHRCNRQEAPIPKVETVRRQRRRRLAGLIWPNAGGGAGVKALVVKAGVELREDAGRMAVGASPKVGGKLVDRGM